MKRSALFFASILVVVVIFAGKSSALFADQDDLKIAILSFENLTDLPKNNQTFLDHLLYKELDKKFSVAPQEEIEDFLAGRRIRYTGGINKLNARMLRKTLGVDAVLVGSADLLAESARDVYVGLTLRLVSALDGSVLWADSLSYAGGDFTTILGLGRVTSLEELSSRVVKALLRDLTPEDIVRKLADTPTEIAPFELEKVVIDSFTGREGETVNIKLNVLSITDKPAEITGVWNGTKVKFKNIKDGEYEGSSVFGKNGGVYHLDIFMTDRNMRTFPFYSVAKITVDNNPPVVKLAVSDMVFSPRRKGHTIFTPVMMSLDEISGWSMDILNEKGEKVRGDKGYNKLPKGLIWRGENDARRGVEDGVYTYRFTVKDTAGNEMVISDTVRVKNKPPQIDVDIDAVEGRLIFFFDSDNEEKVQSWSLVLLDTEGKEVKVIKGKDRIPATVDYLISNDEIIDNLSFSFTATDEAGNIFKTSSSIPSILFRKSPFTNIPFTKKMNGRGFMIEDF